MSSWNENEFYLALLLSFWQPVNSMDVTVADAENEEALVKISIVCYLLNYYLFNTSFCTILLYLQSFQIFEFEIYNVSFDCNISTFLYAWHILLQDCFKITLLQNWTYRIFYNSNFVKFTYTLLYFCVRLQYNFEY